MNIFFLPVLNAALIYNITTNLKNVKWQFKKKMSPFNFLPDLPYPPSLRDLRTGTLVQPHLTLKGGGQWANTRSKHLKYKSPRPTWALSPQYQYGLWPLTINHKHILKTNFKHISNLSLSQSLDCVCWRDVCNISVFKLTKHHRRGKCQIFKKKEFFYVIL